MPIACVISSLRVRGCACPSPSSKAPSVYTKAYLSYCSSPPILRYAAVQSKFSEVGFSSSDNVRPLGVFTLLPDLVHAQYPTSFTRRVLHAQYQRPNNRVWVDMIPLVIYTMRFLHASYTGN